MKKQLFVIGLTFIGLYSKAQEKVLMFVSNEDTYYSEYIVMKRGLEASGYEVDVRNASGMESSTYMIPTNTTINETANTLSGSSYTQFTSQFLDFFGKNWNRNDNATPNFIPVNGKLQDIADLSAYKALIIVGGTGALAYRVDGIYESQGTANRLINATTIQTVAEKLNTLALEALTNGKPIMAQCHGASLAPYWRVSLQNGLGDSLLKGQYATGFPEPETATYLQSLGVNFRTNDRVTISSPNNVFSGATTGAFKIITTRDWYPQTVAHAARSILNILETYPKTTAFNNSTKVLVLHGGAVDPNNCGAGNRTNDVPCNYGGGTNLPADYSHIVDLLQNKSANDNFNFSIENINITSSNLPFTANNKNSIENYLNQYDAIVFFKHWNTGLTTELQQALVSYVDNGGGIIALHHGLYNDTNGSVNKNILTQQLFGAESHTNNWSANRTNYTVYNTNYGHFVSTYGINTSLDSDVAPASWTNNSLLQGSNSSFSYYQRFTVFDEIYNNMTFLNGQTFGRNTNQITPLFSNNQIPNNQTHTTGFVKKFNASDDSTIGRVAYFEIGETIANFNNLHPYGQVIRNAITWSAHNKVGSNPTLSVLRNKNIEIPIAIYPNPFQDFIILHGISDPQNIQMYDTVGQKIIFVTTRISETEFKINTPNLNKGFYIIKYKSNFYKILKN